MFTKGIACINQSTESTNSTCSLFCSEMKNNKNNNKNKNNNNKQDLT